MVADGVLLFRCRTPWHLLPIRLSLQALPKQPKRRDRASIKALHELARRFLKHRRLLTLCSTDTFGVLRGNGGHERPPSLEPPFSWRCRLLLLLLKLLDKSGAAVIGWIGPLNET